MNRIYPTYEGGAAICPEDGETIALDKSNPLRFVFVCTGCNREFDLPPEVDAKERGNPQLF